MAGKPLSPEKFLAKFWSLVEKTDACWLWRGGKYRQGYGRISRNGIRECAHRVSYEIKFGTIPDGMLACHHCDVKECVNPDHIFIGTYVDNMQDWTKKGKNRLANDRSLWSNGKHWKTNPKAKAKLSALRKAEFASGRRVNVFDEKNKLRGTRMVG